jgi:hypothetical protein
MIGKRRAALLLMTAAVLAMSGASTAVAKMKTGTKDICSEAATTVPAQGVGSVPLATGKLPKKAKVTDVDARLRASDSFTTLALTVFLTSPKGGLSVLSNAEPHSPAMGANDFGTGTGCAAGFTTFDDEAATPISAGTSPFAGSFRPDTPLAGMDGSLAAGVWGLYASDCCEGDVASINAVGLKITYRYPAKKKGKK